MYKRCIELSSETVEKNVPNQHSFFKNFKVK